MGAFSSGLGRILSSRRYNTVIERIVGRSIEAQAQSCLNVLPKPSSTGLPAKSQTLLGRRATNSQTFGGWLYTHLP
ncbi:MAG: hypothetical protein LBF72_00290 [Holosporales bacterium]|nr:hypothetical protein [Holosporales bacterium]